MKPETIAIHGGYQRTTGAVLSPWSAFLLRRGIETVPCAWSAVWKIGGAGKLRRVPG